MVARRCPVHADARLCLRVIVAAIATRLAMPLRADELPQCHMKAVALYDFAYYTVWPKRTAGPLRVCVLGEAQSGENLDGLRSCDLGSHRVSVSHRASVTELDDCQVLYVARSEAGAMADVVKALHGRPVLTVADSPGATHQGIMINMAIIDRGVKFTASRRAARAAGLDFSSKMLNLAAAVDP